MNAGRRIYRRLHLAWVRVFHRRDLSPRGARTIPAEPEAVRFARLADGCVTGQLAAAELELFEWSRHPDCPADARVLLASLLTRRGKLEDARAVMHSPRRPLRESDASLAQMLACNLIVSGLPDAAARALREIDDDHGHLESVGVWTHVMASPSAPALAPSPSARVEQLAGELAAKHEVIASLVAAQKIEPVAPDIALLRNAIARATRHLKDNTDATLAACQGLAELALLAGDLNDARRWAHRGLKINPFAVSLALVVAKVSDDASVGRPAIEVLAGAAEAFPKYPDLRAALIRREKSDGRPEAARRRLALWQEAQPNHPVVQQLQRELAA